MNPGVHVFMLGMTSLTILCLALWAYGEGWAPARVARIANIFDHLGQMGGREVARSSSACIRTLLTAGGAGIVTAITVALKVVIGHSPLQWLSGGLLGALNLIVSFLFIQVFGFRLATKQSALFGAAFARRLKELLLASRERLHLDDLRWMARTQFFSALGNVAFVIPAAILLNFAVLRFTGAPFVEAGYARSTLASMHPWQSGALGYAALTGAILWLCTLAGGLVADRFPSFSKTAATTAFNVTLGIALTCVPLIGKLLHIPLEVRHFTLSGGSVAISVASLGLRRSFEYGLLPAAAGVLCIGILNFSVSFMLAFLSSWLGRARKNPLLNLKPYIEPLACPFRMWQITGV